MKGSSTRTSVMPKSQSGNATLTNGVRVTTTPIIYDYERWMRFNLDAPNYVRVAYEISADHLWTTKHLPDQNITDLPDCGWNDTLPARALRRNGIPAPFNAITVHLEKMKGISLIRDDIYGTVMNFKAENESCMKLVDFSILSTDLLNNCLRDQANCPFGISVATWIRFNPTDLRFGEAFPLLDMGDETGFKLYLKDRATYAQLVSNQTRWKAQAQSEHIFAKQWACVGFTWSAQHGIRVGSKLMFHSFFGIINKILRFLLLCSCD